MTDCKLYEIFVTSIISFPWQVNMTFNFCNLHSFLACQNQRGTVFGRIVVYPMDMDCNCTGPHPEYIKESIFWWEKISSGLSVTVLLFPFIKLGG